MNKAPINALMNSVQWSETGKKQSADGLPYATHCGVLDVVGVQLRCYRLNDGRVIFDAEDVRALFGDLLGAEAA